VIDHTFSSPVLPGTQLGPATGYVMNIPNNNVYGSTGVTYTVPITGYPAAANI